MNSEIQGLGGQLPDFAGKNLELVSVQLSSRRTGLSFQRTKMSADRTLMSIIRTSLSLIGFGFTIFQFFRSLRESAATGQIVPQQAARNFGLALELLGVGLLALGIGYHVAFMKQLRRERRQFIDQGMIPGDDSYPVSLTLITAVLLLLLGLVAIAGMVMRAGPFG